jgi:hypothetical protein
LTIVGILGVLLALYLLVRLMSTSAEIVQMLKSAEQGPVAVQPPVVDASKEPRPPITMVVPDAAARLPRRAIVGDASPSETEEDAGTNVDSGTLEATTEEPAADAAAQASTRPDSAVQTEAKTPVPCGWRTCPEGEVCCNWACSICKPPGQYCDWLCGAPNFPVSVPCGPNTCNTSQICCNRTCGTCVEIGESCSQEPCDTAPYYPFSELCGTNTCNVGQVCCNPSCGICTAPGESCSQTPCP